MAELAVQLGAVALAPGGLDSARPLTRARAAWNDGDITEAIRLARPAGRAGQRYAARLASERATLAPGFALDIPLARTRPTPGSNIRALHVLTNSVPHTASGYAFRSHEVLKAQAQAGIAVAGLTRIGYPVTVGLTGARDSDEVEGITYHRLLTPRLAGLPATRLQQMVRQALPIVESFAPTVLHTTTNYTNALVTQALAAALGVPWIYEVRGQLEKTWLASRHPSVQSAAEASERYRLLREKETEMILAADHVVAISETLRQDIIARGRVAGDVTVIPNGVDPALLEQNLAPHQAREALGLPTEGFWVGSVSSLVDYEGFDTLIEAIAALRAEGLDVRGAIVGDGVARPDLIAQTRRLGLQDWIRFPGRVPRHHVSTWYQGLDAFIAPRRDLPVTRIVTPLKPMEAMALERPVIASDVPALAEIVSAPGAGTTFHPGDVRALADQIAALQCDRDLATAYAIAGRSFARGRTWRTAGLAHAEIYEEVKATR
ncbi:glycosyltransferase family 4 protein [Pseudactinotalea sp. Z1732]|uniref:glycosyltransferase family 4 protein n=1 Tax=Micrococcales TaxID=85006 RepID=UPI003C7B6C29